MAASSYLPGPLRAAVVCLLALPAPARAPGEPLLETALVQPRSVAASRATTAIHVDGLLDEPAWAAAAPGEQFIQQRPVPGVAARLRTAFGVSLMLVALWFFAHQVFHLV